MASGVDGVDQERLQQLIAQQQQVQQQNLRIQQEIDRIKTGSSSYPQQNSTRIQKHQRRQSQIPRALTNHGVDDASTLDHRLSLKDLQATARSSSQQDMRRTASKESSSSRGLPFTQTGPTPPTLRIEAQADNQVMLDVWQRDPPYNPYTFSQMRTSSSQRNPDMQRVPELGDVGETPGSFLARVGMDAPPVPPATTLRHRASVSRRSLNIPIPTTPTTPSLTDAATMTMSRQTSLCNEPLLESIQMMKVNSQASYSSDLSRVDNAYHVSPIKAPDQSLYSNDERLSHLLMGAGFAMNASPNVPRSLPQSVALARFHSATTDLGGEKMEISQSNESSSSSSSSNSRNKQRLQVSNQAAARQLMPKAGDDYTMSRDPSSLSMARQGSKDIAAEKLAIAKPPYQRPRHDRVFCQKCDEHPEGFRGEHELRRHCDRQHKSMVKKWICVEPKGSSHPTPAHPLSRCKSCTQLKKRYGAKYNAAAHLRRAHFRPKSKGRNKSTKVDDSQKRGGKGGGDWPPMNELKHWMREVEEPAPDYSAPPAEPQDADESDEDDLATSAIDEVMPVNDAETQDAMPQLSDFYNTQDSESYFDTALLLRSDSWRSNESTSIGQPSDSFKDQKQYQQDIDLSMMSFTHDSHSTIADPTLSSSLQDFTDGTALDASFFDTSLLSQQQQQGMVFDESAYILDLPFDGESFS